MIILHDNPGTADLTHIQAMAEMEEGFASLDYVSINQQDNKSWIGQVIQPNRNISTVSGPLDSTVRHGLKLMQSNPDVQSVESVQVFDILILGEYDGHQLLTLRVRPLPGATVEKLDVETTNRVIGTPQKSTHGDGSFNVIGELLNADDVPLCIDTRRLNHHIMVAGGTGSGKSNVAANLIDQAVKFKKCVLVHDAKPDYRLIKKKNSDPNVKSIWERFKVHGLEPRPASNVIHIGFYNRCDPNNVDVVVGFHASDFSPSMLAGLFFTGSNEQLQFEGFVSAADSLRDQKQSGSIESYSLNDILEVVRERMGAEDPLIQINDLVGRAILRKVNTRRRGMPWLDAAGLTIGRQTNRSRVAPSPLTQSQNQKVQAFNLDQTIEKGRILVIDYGYMDDDESYALILSYFLRICQSYRRRGGEVGIVQMVDEAHRIFDNESRHSDTLARSFSRSMREGRSVDHSIILSLQNASQIHQLVMNNLNSHIVMRQNSKGEAASATQKMGIDYSAQALQLGTGHALVKMFESTVTVLAQMAPSPFELMRPDNSETDDSNVFFEDDDSE